jgi:hypothetical protein
VPDCWSISAFFFDGKWASRIGLQLSDTVRVVLRGAPYVEQNIIQYANETIDHVVE